MLSLACLKKRSTGQSATLFFTRSQNSHPTRLECFQIESLIYHQSVERCLKRSWLHTWLMTPSRWMRLYLLTPPPSRVTHGPRLNCLTRDHYRQHMFIKYFHHWVQAFWWLCIMLTWQLDLRRFSENQFDNEPLCLARFQCFIIIIILNIVGKNTLICEKYVFIWRYYEWVAYQSVAVLEIQYQEMKMWGENYFMVLICLVHHAAALNHSYSITRCFLKQILSSNIIKSTWILVLIV